MSAGAETIKTFPKNLQYYKFCLYGFLKNLRFFDAFIILFFRDCGLSFLQIGTLYSIREITVQVFEIPSGMAADSWGRRKAMLLALSAYIFSFFLFYYSGLYSLFVAAMIMYGIGEAFRSGTHKAIIFDYLKRNNMKDIKTQYYGHTRSWSQMGSALAALGGMIIVFGSGMYRTIFLFTTIPYVLDLILIRSYPKELDGAGQSKIKWSLLENFRKTLIESKIALKDKNLLKNLISASLVIATFKSLKDYIQPMIKNMAIGLPFLMSIDSISNTQKESVLIGVIYFIIFVITSFSARNAYRVEQICKSLPKAANRIYMIAAFTLLTAGILFSFKYYVPAVIIFFGLYISQNLRRPIMVSFLSEKIPEKIMATGLSVESQLTTIIIAVFSPLVGYIIDEFTLGAGILTGGIILLLAYPVARLKVPQVS